MHVTGDVTQVRSTKTDQPDSILFFDDFSDDPQWSTVFFERISISVDEPTALADGGERGSSCRFIQTVGNILDACFSAGLLSEELDKGPTERGLREQTESLRKRVDHWRVLPRGGQWISRPPSRVALGALQGFERLDRGYSIGPRGDLEGRDFCPGSLVL
jgi:hypothetical protein